MSRNCLKVFSVYKNDWHLSDLTTIDIAISHKFTQTKEELLNEVKGCHGIIVTPRCQIDKEILDAVGPQLKVISTTSTGYNHIDIEECYKRGVLVGYVPYGLAEACSELAVALVLTVTRKLKDALQLANQIHWSIIRDEKLLTGKSIRGSTIGIFGLGNIGLEVAKRLSAFNVKKVIYNNRKQSQEASKLGYEYVTFDGLLAESDILICCASLNNSTEKVFDLSAFKKMKPTAIFVNVARGGLVNQEDLCEALKTNVISGAGLDTTTPEPLPNDHSLYALPNCVIFPHIAFDDEQTRAELEKIGLLNLINGLTGKPLVYQVPRQN